MSKIRFFYYRFYNILQYLPILITIVIFVIIGLFFKRKEIVEGYFLLSSIVLAAIFSFYKYQTQIRVVRLQKIYFEHTLLGQAKAIEEMMSQTNINMQLTENLYFFSLNVLDQNLLTLDEKKATLYNAFNEVRNNIRVGIKTTELKMETISMLMKDKSNKCQLATWIGFFENDTYKFSFFLRSQIDLILIQINRLSGTNFNHFRNDFLPDIMVHYVRRNYCLINRHYILFKLFTKIMLEFASENYSTAMHMKLAFKKGKIKEIENLINQYFILLISDFHSIGIGNISIENAARLDERRIQILRNLG